MPYGFCPAIRLPSGLNGEKSPAGVEIEDTLIDRQREAKHGYSAKQHVPASRNTGIAKLLRVGAKNGMTSRDMALKWLGICQRPSSPAAEAKQVDLRSVGVIVVTAYKFVRV